MARKQNTTVSPSVDLVMNQIQQGDDYAPFGVNDEDVQIYHKNDKDEWVPYCSLRDFFAEWEQFKKAWQDLVKDSPAAFVNYGTNTPGQNNSSTINSKVKVWFDTNGE